MNLLGRRRRIGFKRVERARQILTTIVELSAAEEDICLDEERSFIIMRCKGSFRY